MSEVRLCLFGMPRLEYQGTPLKIGRRKALALAAYLALTPQPQSREAVASLLWPELDDEHARSALRSALHTLMTPIPTGWIEANRTAVQLQHDRTWIDVQAFLALLSASEAHDHGPDSLCDVCVNLYTQAIALYQADFMEGFSLADTVEYDDWQLAQRQWLRREYAQLHRRLSDYHAQARQYGPAISHARAWLEVDSLHEPAHRQLMRLYAASGQRSEALRQYQQCTELLDAELVTVPDEETTHLYRMLQDSPPAEPADAQAQTAPPLSGIMPPLPALMVGREQALTEIRRRIGIGSAELQPVTVIQGWPGVGKSTMMAMLAHDTEVARHFPDGVLWASLGENPNVLAEISAWADALMPHERGRPRRIEEISAQLTSVLRDRRMLLLVDDVWQIEHARPFRVGGQQCALVISSRLNDVATALAPAPGDIYRLHVLNEPAALELLGRLTPETLSTYPDEARELVRDLEGLPLAIQVAGRLLHSEAHLGWGVRELLAELNTGAHLLRAQAPSDMLGAGHAPPPTIAALLRRSTDLLDPETRRFFAYLGLFVPKPATFDLEAMAVAWDVDDPRPVARVLVNRGLLEPISGGRFQMHALLVMHARALLEETEDRL